jgi:KilA-N domain/P63C domain
MNIIEHAMHGVVIGLRQKDGYISATALCKAHNAVSGENVRPKEWLATERALKNVYFLACKLNLTDKNDALLKGSFLPLREELVNQGFWGLLIVNKGGKHSGTWIHPKLAVPFATWLSVEFEFQVSEWIEEWLTTGKIASPKTPQEKYLQSLILDYPRPWSEHFCPEWIKNSERLTGWSWGWRCMGRFLKASVYDYFPKAMNDRLNVVNPMDGNGRRPNKQHQHFEECVDEKALRKHIDTVLTLMQCSASLNEFWRLMDAKFNSSIQLSFDLRGESDV